MISSSNFLDGQNSPIKNVYGGVPPTIEPDDPLDIEAFAMLRDIERMTAQNEVDVAKYQNYTEKRYNTEKFVEEMEMKKEFPELVSQGALDIERAHMLKLSDAKIEGKKMEHNLLRGKDIVLELLE